MISAKAVTRHRRFRLGGFTFAAAMPCTALARASAEPAKNSCYAFIEGRAVKFKRRSTSPLRKQARKGFRGYPAATLAFYGPDDTRASKVAVGIVRDEGGEVAAMERWFSDDQDVRKDQEIGDEIL